MTNLAKAIASATHCLKWTAVSTVENMRGTLVCNGRPGSILSFNLDSAEDLEAVLREFLGKRHSIVPEGRIRVKRIFGFNHEWRAIRASEFVSTAEINRVERRVS